MIKFFRRIRQRFLSENKFSRYLPYAIGEIILVVIGILIALQINNWNEDRKDRKLESIYYCRILDDFELDRKLIADALDQVNEKLDYGRQLILDLHAGEKDKRTILNDYLRMLRLEVFVPRRIAFNDLTTSGNIKILSDIQLKNTLTRYYAELENILQQINQNRNELVRRSYPDDPARFGIQEFDYVRNSIGPEIYRLLPNVDWTKDKGSAQFISFQDDVLFIITMYERHKHHLERIAREMEVPYKALNAKCFP